MPPRRWEPDVPLGQIDSKAVAAASTLQRAIAPCLERLHCDITIDSSEIIAAGLESYRKAFGHAVSKRHFDRLIARTIERDAGAEEWTRIELYLPERIAVKKPQVPAATGFDQAWSTMLAITSMIAAKPQPSHEELCLFWDHAFTCYENVIHNGRSEKRARRDLRVIIEQKVPFISARGRALEVKIKRTLARWIAGGRSAVAVKDARSENPGRPRSATLPAEYREKLLARAMHSAGGLTQAFRESQEEGWCPSTVARAYPFNPESKSYVPESLRVELQPELDRLADLAIGPKHAKLHGPYVERDYTNMPSGVQFQSDDCTLPIYFWIPDANGAPLVDADGRPVLTRGQFLPWIDTRTTYIVTFQLIPEKTYDSIEIMRGIARLHDEFGLPEELYFEHGIWGSKLIDGSDRENVPWLDFAYGLHEHGVRVRHADSPGAKIVERVHGALQDLMNNLRGYCGRDEKVDCPEETKKALQLVKAGHAHPSEYFYSFPEWVAKLEAICNRYNSTVQNGKLLENRSPEQGFVDFRKSPPIQLPPQLRYLLARHRREVTVRANGVEIRIGRRKFVYKDEQTSARIHERVLAWFNPEEPDTICITDLDHKNPFTVKRATTVDAYNADSEQIAQAQAENAAQTSHAKTLFGRLRRNFPEEFQRSRRLIQVPQATVALGIAMDQQRRAAGEAEAEREALRLKSERLSRKLGLQQNSRRVNPERVQALTELDRAGVKAVNPYSYEDAK